MGEVPVNIKNWQDFILPDNSSGTKEQLVKIADWLGLIYARLGPSITEGLEDNMPAPLKIGLEIPTGSKFELPGDFNSWGGENWIRDRLDSDLGIDGHKFFAFESFDSTTSLSDGYNFTVDIDSAFTTVDTTATPYIQCYLLNPVKVAKLGLQFLGGWSDYSLGYFPNNLVSWVKKGNWAAQLSATPGEIILKPNLLSWVGFFSVKVQDEGWKSAVIRYEQANKKFIVLGY